MSWVEMLSHWSYGDVVENLSELLNEGATVRFGVATSGFNAATVTMQPTELFVRIQDDAVPGCGPTFTLGIGNYREAPVEGFLAELIEDAKHNPSAYTDAQFAAIEDSALDNVIDRSRLVELKRIVAKGIQERGLVTARPYRRLLKDVAV